MADCQNLSLAHHLNNERTPFVEYVVPVFTFCYYWLLHRVIKNCCDSRCEKRLESNQHIKLYKTDEQDDKRLADGVGFFSNSCRACWPEKVHCAGYESQD